MTSAKSQDITDRKINYYISQEHLQIEIRSILLFELTQNY